MKIARPEIETKMDKAIKALENEYATIRAGRANPSVLNKVSVDYYGVPTPVQQMAAVAVTDARTITITPWDPSTLTAIEKAILASDVGITPTNDGKSVRLNFPPLTEERRKELVKEVKKMAENSKVAIRNMRRDAIEDFKKKEKANEITEDDLKIAESDVQELTDKFVKNIDKIAEAKEKEILEI